MDPLNVVSSAIQKITSAYGKKVHAAKTAAPIPEAKPFTIEGEKYSVGFGRQEIMPDLKLKREYWIAGHGSGHKMQGILTKVYAHAMWIGLGDEGIMWLSIDCVGLTNTEAEIIRRKILEDPLITGCRAVNVSVTHSHSGIDTLGYWGKPFASIPANGKVPEYMAALYVKCLWAAEDAYKNAKEGKLYFGSASIEGGLHTGRRIADKHEIMHRVRFVPDDGSNETWMLNIGAHPNSLGGDNRLLSGEYPYYLREMLKRETDADVLVCVGAIGGMDAKHYDGDPDRINWIKKQARFFADASKSVADEKELKPEIRFLRQPFYMPACNNVLMLLAMKGTMSFNAFPCDCSDTGVASMTEMTYVDLGGAKLLCLPGENFVSTVYGPYTDAENSPTGFGGEINPVPLAEIAGDPDLVVFDNTNDMTGYVVPPNDWVLNPGQPYLNGIRDRFNENHYHETNSMGPDTQKVIADTFATVVKNMG